MFVGINMNMEPFLNPFRPGAGQRPPYLAGRLDEQNEFNKMLDQNPVIQNLIITGLRGVGKTVLLEILKPLAVTKGWLWAGTDLSESATISEQNLSTRIIADLSTITSAFVAAEIDKNKMGFNSLSEKIPIKGSYQFLWHKYSETPGLDNDKLKAVLETVWELVKGSSKGIVLAYDEAQLLKDQASDKQYPLSLLLEVIQYLQRKQIPYLLILTGLPTLFPNLVAARTYAERMFHVLTIDKLANDECYEAIKKPIEVDKCPVKFSEEAISTITSYSGGYPYFIQFLCKESFDSYIQQLRMGSTSPTVLLDPIVRKLDTDFYSGRWGGLTDRQKDLLKVISELPTADTEFSVSEIEKNSITAKRRGFGASQINQMLAKMIPIGLIYKNRHGKYSFAVPLLSGFIKRQQAEDISFDDFYDFDDVTADPYNEEDPF
jgi:hypothetical protein